jgi:molybdopterin-guanine dinucleotide biosynthesis protein A
MITIVLQAGGESTRMGKDKALLPFLGIPLIKRLMDRFQQVNADMLIISNNYPAYQGFGLPVFGDVRPGRGALGGLLTALSVANTPLVGLVAADLPFASPQLIEYMADRIQGSNWDGIIPSTADGLEPLHAIYRREGCLSLVEQAVDQDLWRMVAWHKNANLKILTPDETLEITGSEYTFLNLNTIEEFNTAEEIARNLGLE